jgi:hypothetical protein
VVVECDVMVGVGVREFWLVTGMFKVIAGVI